MWEGWRCNQDGHLHKTIHHDHGNQHIPQLIIRHYTHNNKTTSIVALRIGHEPWESDMKLHELFTWQYDAQNACLTVSEYHCTHLWWKAPRCCDLWLFTPWTPGWDWPGPAMAWSPGVIAGPATVSLGRTIDIDCSHPLHHLMLVK